MPELAMLLIGDTGRAEFHAAVTCLREQSVASAYDTIDSALARWDELAAEPDLILLLASRPGEFSHVAVDALMQRAPLARVVAVLGSWCEGETRSGAPWPGVARVYAHQAASRIERELTALRQGLCGGWGQAVTATDEERLLLDESSPLPPAAGCIVIHSHRAEMAEWLATACRAGGHDAVWLQTNADLPANATAAIYNGYQASDRELDEVRKLAEALGGAPVIALLNFPRADDVERMKAVGAVAVLGKPVLVDDLTTALALASTPPAPPRFTLREKLQNQ